MPKGDAAVRTHAPAVKEIRKPVECFPVRQDSIWAGIILFHAGKVSLRMDGELFREFPVEPPADHDSTGLLEVSQHIHSPDRPGKPPVNRARLQAVAFLQELLADLCCKMCDPVLRAVMVEAVKYIAKTFHIGFTVIFSPDIRKYSLCKL